MSANLPTSSIALVSFIRAPAFAQACKLPGSVQLQLFLQSILFMTLAPDKINLSFISSKYHEFANVFSDSWANTLVLHCTYDLKIELNSDQAPLPGSIYSLSVLKQKALRQFPNENLNSGFI